MAEPGVEGENDAPEGDGNGEGQLVEALPSASIDGVFGGGLLHLHPSRARARARESEREREREGLDEGKGKKTESAEWRCEATVAHRSARVNRSWNRIYFRRSDRGEFSKNKNFFE